MNKKIKWSKSILTNLLKWFVLLSLVPIVIISLLAYKNSSDSLYTAVSNELEHSASSYVNFINNWFDFRQTDIKLWSASSNNMHFMQALNEGLAATKKSIPEYINSHPYVKLTQSYQNDIVELTRHYDYIYDLFLIDVKGNILYTVAKEDDLGSNLLHGKHASTRFAQTFKRSLHDGKVHFSDFESYIPSEGGVYGFLTAPIISEKGHLLGVFAVQVHPDGISRQFDKVNKEDNGILHYILGGNDLKLRSSIGVDTDILYKRIQTPQTDLYQTEHVHNEIGAHEEYIQSYTGPKSTPVIGTHHPVSILDVKWVLISEIDSDVALASTYTLAYKIILIALLTIIFVLLSSLFVARRITKPIEILAEASENISSGGIKKPVSIDDDNEIGQFAEAFNNMIEELSANETALLERSKEAQAALNEVKEQKLALDAHSIVAITDVKGSITYVNDKFIQISGYSKEELIGQNHRILQTDEQSKEFWIEMYKTISSGKIWHDEIKNRAKDGHFYWVDTTIVPFFNEDKKPESYVAIRTDITEKKANEIKLIEAKEAAEAGAKSKAEFLASMSHEIRTPMNGVIGMLGLLKNSELSQTQGHQVSIAESSAQSLLMLINDILDLSKVEAGKLDLEDLEFNLRDDLGDFAHTIAFRAQEKGVELILDVKEVEKSLIISDPGRLRQILTNIVGNAIKFTSEGEIVITCKLVDEGEGTGRLFVSVKDSGIGIPEDKIADLFDSFTQVDSSTTRKYGGTGLGLSIVKKLTQLMGGSICVTSKKGEGSTFSFDIEVGISENASLVIPRVDVKGKRVLLVDDNPVNREVVRVQLEYWGMEVTEAEDGVVALKRLKKELLYGNTPPFDIALIDMHMPNMDGSELGKKIKATPAYEEMKLVMMTSLGTRDDAQKFAEIGFNAFFPKPTTTKDLFNVLNVLIDDAQTLNQLDNFLTKDRLHAMNEPDEISPWPQETRILLVEDNMTNQIVANGILETFGLSADVANDGEEALLALKDAKRTKPFTLVLMDCQMPVLDGYDTSEAIRRGEGGEENIQTPIIAMTANAMKGDKERCIASGMDDYLSKPINPDTLNNILIKWLKKNNNHNALQEDQTSNEVPNEEVLSWDKTEALGRLAGKEDILKKVIEIYLDDSLTQFEALEKAIHTNAKRDAQLHAHSIRGSSANIGAGKLERIAKKMERSAKDKDIQSVASAFKEAEEEVEILRGLLKTFLA